MEIMLTWDHPAAYQKIGCCSFIGQKILKSTTRNVLLTNTSLNLWNSMQALLQVLDCNDNAHSITIFAPNTDVPIIPQHLCVASVDHFAVFNMKASRWSCCLSFFVSLCWVFYWLTELQYKSAIMGHRCWREILRGESSVQNCSMWGSVWMEPGCRNSGNNPGSRARRV